MTQALHYVVNIFTFHTRNSFEVYTVNKYLNIQNTESLKICPISYSKTVSGSSWKHTVQSRTSFPPTIKDGQYNSNFR